MYRHYIRVTSPKFIEGHLSDCVYLQSVIDEVESRALVSTARNLGAGTGNIDPRKALRQQPGAVAYQRGGAAVVGGREQAGQASRADGWRAFARRRSLATFGSAMSVPPTGRTIGAQEGKCETSSPLLSSAQDAGTSRIVPRFRGPTAKDGRKLRR